MKIGKSCDAKVNNSHRWKVWDKRKGCGTSNSCGGLDNQKEVVTEMNFIMGSQISGTVTSPRISAGK